MERHETATPDMKPRAYVSGDAGHAFVVDNGETYLLTSTDPHPHACNPALLTNVLSLCSDVDIYEVPSDLLFTSVAADVKRRTGLSRCVDYITALLDPELPRDLRVRAAELAEVLLQDAPDTLHEVERVFLNITAPPEADLLRAIELSKGYRLVRLLVLCMDVKANQIARLHERWEQEIADLPTLAARSAATAVMTERALVAELLLGTSVEALVAEIDPIVRQAVARWARSSPVLPIRFLLESLSEDWMLKELKTAALEAPTVTHHQGDQHPRPADVYRRGGASPRCVTE